MRQVLYHASPVAGLTQLLPHKSEHGEALVYFSQKRENTLVYLCNAVEKFCRQAGVYREAYTKWGSYGFDADGILRLDEYYPDATAQTYAGVPGYIYAVQADDTFTPLPSIPYAYVCRHRAEVCACQAVPDALRAMELARDEGKIRLCSYARNTQQKLRWIENAVKEELAQADKTGRPEYAAFLRAKFPFLAKD